ncbi:acyltransferase family-domain-containing protein [Thermothelomyces heterothallicus CBS 202.75]|uniref:acyltransferase family-domain-containing protein n=1 Tax=Thermothelomyces heterothallicus CBS 202.75 TaxID=1149848 RepID=UPI003742DED2
MKSIAFRGLRHLLWPWNGGGGSGSSGSGSSSDGPRPLRPTAYLDGLRGFAALMVYFHHHQLWAHATPEGDPVFQNAFGSHGEYHLATFFFIRNFFSGGHFAVAIFFVISGYVLSAKPLSLIHAGEHVKLLDNLASAFFRRWFRLYIPVIVTTFVYVTSWHVLGIYNAGQTPKKTLGEELWNWYVEFKNFSFLYKDGWLYMSANQHLWSISHEMRGSVIIFAACVALARATHKARLLCELALIFYFLYIVDGFSCALFMAGMLQCDLTLLARREGGGGYFPRWLRRLERHKTLIYYLLFVVGMYLGGVPSNTQEITELREEMGWHYLSYLKPQAVFDFKWFYLFFAGNIMVACAARLGWLKRFLESAPCQFLGRVSYALYLVHGPVLHTVGDLIYYAVGWSTGADIQVHGPGHGPVKHWESVLLLPKVGPLGLELSFLLPNLLVILPLTLWLATLVTRFVDEPSVRFPAWLYKRVLGGGEAEPKPVELAPLTRVE